MAEQMRPASKEQAPDPAVNFDRSDPKRESGAGRMTNNTNATPTPRPDKMPETVSNAQTGHVQVNAQESATKPKQPKKSTGKDEPVGWDPKAKKV